MNWNNKILSIIFFALLAVWILNKTLNRVSDTSFKATLMQIDTATVNKLVLYPKGIDSLSFTLKKQNGKWNLSNGQISTFADQERVNSILSQVAYIPTKRLISKKEENQVDYEVDDHNGKIVEVYEGDKLTNKVIFGRFNFNPTTRTATSYGRLANDNEIYALDGMISMSFDTDFNSFRNNKLVNINKEDIRGIMYNGSLIQPIGENLWAYKNEPLDSLTMINYLDGLSNISSTSFADDFSKSSAEGSKSISINVDNKSTPVELTAHVKSNGFVIKSSENDAFFLSDSSGIYNKIFGELDAIINHDDT